MSTGLEEGLMKVTSPLKAPVEWHRAGETFSCLLGIPDLTQFKPEMIYKTPNWLIKFDIYQITFSASMQKCDLDVEITFTFTETKKVSFLRIPFFATLKMHTNT